MTERIKSLIAQMGLSTRAFALSCGLRQNTLSNQLNGMRELSLSTVMAILAAYPDVSSEWLLRGEGEMFVRKDDNSEDIARINGLVDTITTLNDALKAKSETIAMYKDRIAQLENKLNK